MQKPKLPKEAINKIGRVFALLFNRAVMYDIDHPFTQQSSDEFLTVIGYGLGLHSPLVLILNQDHFFIEEEALDPRINTSKMLFHFKKAGIRSVSFHKGLNDEELHRFVKIFINLARHPDAEAMTSGLEHQGIEHIRINHVFYKKVTADDEVIDRRSLKSDATMAAGGSRNLTARRALTEEPDTAISLQNLLDDPANLARSMFAAAGSETDKQTDVGQEMGGQLLRHLQQLKTDIDQMSPAADPIRLEELAEAVYHLKSEVFDGIEAHKARGIDCTNETEIRREADDLTDQVLIKLVREEFTQGHKSMKRFAQVLDRLMPGPKELKRLIPRIKETLMAEGMSPNEFQQLSAGLSHEIQDEKISHLLEESAEEIGVTGKDLLHEINLNPKGAAELIYLASELRKGTGDEMVLSDLLVDYIERIGSKIALDSVESNAEKSAEHLQQVISGVEAELVSRLENKNIDAAVLDRVAQRLNNRLEMCMQKLQSQWRLQTKSISETGSEEPTTVFSILEQSVEEGDELNAILKQVRSKYDRQGLNEDDYNTIYKEIYGAKQKQARRQRPGYLPKGILNRRSTLYILEKEIARSIRYGSPFSVLMISIVKVLPETQMPPGSLSRGQISNAVLEELMNQVRNTDIIGLLDKRKTVVLMPMTIESESKTAMRRILNVVHSAELAIGDHELKVKLAGTVTTFDHQRTPNLEKFVQLAETEIFDMVNRLRNIQSLY